jgi:RNA polymerase sigma-70 factor (ECF subfamily)
VPPTPPHRATFPTTRITLIDAARSGTTSRAQEALSILCRSYWYPIYAYVRRLGYAADEAEDLTQGFFSRLLEKHYLRDFHSERGRFRSFLLTALKHFIANQRDWATAHKRGGARPPLPLDDVMHDAEHRYGLEPRDDLTPDRIFERQWAVAVLARVQDRLQAEATAASKCAQFDRLKGLLTGDDNGMSYRAIAVELATTEGAVKVAVHRLRQRFKELLRDEIAQTVASEQEVGDELRYLMNALRS